MNELLREDDFAELPNEAEHAWVFLQKIARSRLENARGDSGKFPNPALLHYMATVQQLAKSNGVSEVTQIGGPIGDAFDDFELKINRAKVRIWSASKPTFEFSRVKINADTKTTITRLVGEIEIQIDNLETTERRKEAARKALQDFQREVLEDKVRVGAALSKLGQVAAIVIVANAAINEGLDTFIKLQTILGSAQLEQTNEEVLFIDEEKKLLLEGPLKQIEGPKTELK